MTNNPQWQFINYPIENVNILLKELSSSKLLFNVRRKMTPKKPNFILFLRNEIEDLIPDTMKFLESIGLSDRFYSIAYIIVPPNQSFPIHIDGIKNESTNFYSLNFPIKNAENSYTVFYEMKGEALQREVDNSPAKYAEFTEDQVANIITKCDANTVNWLNISVPHRPVVEHDKERIVCSLRFKPEIHDWFEKHFPELK